MIADDRPRATKDEPPSALWLPEPREPDDPPDSSAARTLYPVVFLGELGELVLGAFDSPSTGDDEQHDALEAQREGVATSRPSA